ncbi:MAG: hypothetical protein ACI30O_00810 [Muribaculaceae bacterium]|nr:hypothetical protein [Bacteroidales bacterium]
MNALLRLILATMILVVGTNNSLYAKSKKDMPACEVEVANIGERGQLVLRVWCFAKKASDIKDSEYLEGAIRQVLFQGIQDSGRMKGRGPIVKDGYANHEDYFNDFFAQSKYKNFVKISAGGYVNSGNLIKIGKLYKVGKIVIVNLDELRSSLETDKIIKSLSDGF